MKQQSLNGLIFRLRACILASIVVIAGFLMIIYKSL